NRPWTAEEFTQASMERQRLYNQFWRFMDNYDLLVTPTLTVPPFPVHMQGPERVDGAMVDPVKWLSLVFTFNLTGSPAISLPAGWTKDGRPVGIQFVGHNLADASVLSAAAAFEQTIGGWAKRWPRLVTDLA